jgi:hypothetical protein
MGCQWLYLRQRLVRQGYPAEYLLLWERGADPDMRRIGKGRQPCEYE